MPRNQITLEEVVKSATNSLRNSTYHALPGIVQRFNADDQTVDVVPAVNDPRFDPETGERLQYDANGMLLQDDGQTNAGVQQADEPWPTVPRVPILWPQFGGFVIAGPMAQGDSVFLIAVDLDPTMHRLTGQVESPIDTGRHSGAYWVAIPANITDPKRMASASTAGTIMVMGKDGAANQIRIDGSNIQLGATGADFVALASKVDAELQKIQATLLTGTTTSGPVTFGSPYTASPTGSSLVKSD